MFPIRLSKERVGELQQQIEDLQKTLQEQESKTEGEGVGFNDAFHALTTFSPRIVTVSK